MLHRPVLLIFLFSTVANVYLVQLAKGDQALIDRVCGATPKPDVCRLCFVQDPEADKKDAKALAGTALNCSFSHSKFVTEELQEIANGNDEPVIVEKCERCEQSIANAASFLTGAEASWKNGDFTNAANQLVVATGRLEDCAKIVKGILEIPSISDDFTLLQNYYLDAQAILSKL